MSLFELHERFPNDEAATQWFERVRWKNGRHCPKCGNPSTYAVANKKPLPYRCRKCYRYFSVKSGTVMQSSKLSLRKWACALYLVTTRTKGISTRELAKYIGTSQKTAWMMLHKIREGLIERNESGLAGVIEIDETYAGGKRANMRHVKRKALAGTGRGTVGKAPIVGAVQRGGIAVAHPVDRADAATLQSFVRDNVVPKSTVCTDEHTAYTGLQGDYDHKSVCHSRGQYVDGEIYTNTAESLWATLKRAYMGTHHWWSRKHMHRYVNEVCARWNWRSAGTLQRMACVAAGLEGRVLTWKMLVGTQM